MFTFDEVPFELDPAGSAIQFIIGDRKDGEEKIHWTFSARFTAVEEPVSRGEFAGARELTLQIFGAPAPIGHWHELEGVEDERKERWEITKTLMLFSPVLPPDEIPTHKPMRMSMGHRARVRKRDGYHFTLEVEGVFLPLQMAATATFGGAACTPEEMSAAAQELRMLEELPLAWVGVHVPWNVSDPYLYAQKAAMRLLGLEVRRPGADERPVTPPFPERERGPRELRWVTLVTPYAVGGGD